MNLPNTILSGFWKEGHVQGIAVDLEKGHIYFSFTTILLKTDLAGKPLGSVRNLAGHLGCITFDADRRKVYGSLELKHDSIGKGIIDRTGWNPSEEDNFYLVCFDADKIDRMELDAEKDGIMRAVWLKQVVEEYAAIDPVSDKKHHYGCSGIDGTAFGPLFGEPDGPQYLFTSYGVYSDVTRDDNDHQVLLCYDVRDWKQYERPLSQSNIHKVGPATPYKKLFLYTGNTEYGVQNLEYSPAEQNYLLAVYKGVKPGFPNYDLFAADATKAPVWTKLKGIGEEGWLVQLAESGSVDGGTGLRGWRFPHGSTGLYACQNGDFLISEAHVAESGQCSYIYCYVRHEKRGFVLKG